jgi:hypothetical protein
MITPESHPIIIKAANTVAGGGAVAGGVGALTLNEYLGIAGFAVAAIGALISIWFNFRDDKRKELEHKMRILSMQPPAK